MLHVVREGAAPYVVVIDAAECDMYRIKKEFLKIIVKEKNVYSKITTIFELSFSRLYNFKL